MKKSIKTPSIFISDNRMTLTPDQYNVLHYSSKNRPVVLSHVKKMTESVIRNGVLRLVIVCYDSVRNKYTVIDGQHLTRALINLNQNIECVVRTCESDEERTQLMIDLNNTSKTWKLDDYIHARVESGNKHYKALRLEMEKTDIQLTVLIQAYTQKRRALATKMLKEGTFEIVDKKRGDELIGFIKSCKSFLPNTRPVNEALIQLMITVGNYDNTKMLNNLKQAKNWGKLEISTKEAEIFTTLVSIYNKK